MAKIVRECRKCKTTFETTKDKVLLCKECRKKINPATHCEQCGYRWTKKEIKKMKDGFTYSEYTCSTCKYTISPDLLRDFFSITIPVSRDPKGATLSPQPRRDRVRETTTGHPTRTNKTRTGQE